MTGEAITILHNPRCSKSRQALALVERGTTPYTVIEYLVIEYLKAPPDRATLESIVARLGNWPADLVRTDEPGVADLAVDRSDLSSPARVVELLIDHPELMQRPVVMRGRRAVVGRPPERVVELLD
jgi:arsenate reductase (glutaredoxin)